MQKDLHFYLEIYLSYFELKLQITKGGIFVQVV